VIDSAVELDFGKQNFETDSVKKSENPFYNEFFVLEIHEASQKSFMVNILDPKKKDVVGFVEFLVTDFYKSRDFNSWLTIQAPDIKNSKKSSSTPISGEIQLNFHFHPAEEGIL